MVATTPGRWATLSKGQAFSIHLALSLLIFSSLVLMMIVWWFPGKLFFLDGGWQGLKLVALIDLVLGPALTLLLYKPRKPKLLMDMSLIASIQFVALIYGFYATHQQRTVAVVYADGSFITLSAAAMNSAETQLIGKERQPQSIAKLDNSTPAMMLTPGPTGGAGFHKYMDELLNGFPEPHERLDLFVKRGAEHAETLSKNAITDENLAKSGAQISMDAAIAKGGYDKDDIELHRFKARYARGFVIFDKSEQKILDYVAIDWAKLRAEKAAKLEAQAKTTDDPISNALNAENESSDETNINDLIEDKSLAESVEQ